MAFTAGSVFDADAINEAWPTTVEDDEPANEDNLTSTSFAAGSTQCSLTFTAPTSGRVIVTVHGNLRSNGTNHVILSFEVRQDGEAGTVVVSADDENAVSTQQAEIERQATSKLVSGLTAGGTYFARTMHRVTGGTTADVLHRRLIVQPAS